MADAPDAAETVPVQEESPSLWQWQRSLMPVMIGIIVALTVFFFVSTYIQFQKIQTAILSPADQSQMSATLTKYEISNPDAITPQYLNWKHSLETSDKILHTQNVQISATLLVNVWTRYLGFVTGMVLAIMGAVFIMSKINAGATAMNASGGGFTGSLNTSSPGIVLAVLGTALMLGAMLIRYDYREDVAAGEADKGQTRQVQPEDVRAPDDAAAAKKPPTDQPTISSLNAAVRSPDGDTK